MGLSCLAFHVPPVSRYFHTPYVFDISVTNSDTPLDYRIQMKNLEMKILGIVWITRTILSLI